MGDGRDTLVEECPELEEHRTQIDIREWREVQAGGQ